MVLVELELVDMEVAAVVQIEEDKTVRSLDDTAAGGAAVVQRRIPPANAIVCIAMRFCHGTQQSNARGKCVLFCVSRVEEMLGTVIQGKLPGFPAIIVSLDL